MPEFTKSSVGSLAGTSELEGTTVWPLERKYSRKPERISADFIEPFYCTAEKTRSAGRPLREPRLNLGGLLRLLCVYAPVLQEPRSDCAHRALVCLRELLQCAPGVERGEQLAVLVL